MPKAYLVLSELSRLLGGKSYFVGDGVTLADLHVAPQLDFLAKTPEWKPLTANCTNLISWLYRMNDRVDMGTGGRNSQGGMIYGWRGM
jgi:glutathione S-transferase